MRLSEPARAKVNLCLHVTGRRADGYHTLDSLVAFPDLGDRIEAEAAPDLSLVLDGPFARDLDASGDNSVLRAAGLMRRDGRGAALRLRKALPVASGLGGGSADAAAAMRVLARLWDRALPDAGDVLALGADVPVCLHGRSCRMTGVGERLAPVDLPAFWMVLANPGNPVETAAVFARLERSDGAPVEAVPAFATAADLFAFLRRQRNDLEPAATAIAPAIAEAVAALAARPGCGLARMSGSGATVFGLFNARTEAVAARDELCRAHSGWWVKVAKTDASY